MPTGTAKPGPAPYPRGPKRALNGEWRPNYGQGGETVTKIRQMANAHATRGAHRAYMPPTARRRKGYTKALTRRRGRFANRAGKTVITGTVGTVDGLFQIVDSELEARDWNWSTLAERARVSRSYLVERIRGGQSLPWPTYLRVCAILAIKPYEHLKSTVPTQPSP